MSKYDQIRRRFLKKTWSFLKKTFTLRFIFFSASIIIVPVLSFLIYYKAGNFWAPRQRPTGDEPHYLIIAKSLYYDHDFDLKNNYANKDYQAWGYEGLEMASHSSVNSQNGKEYSIHNIGWPIILAPFFGKWGLAGARIAVEVIAALLALNIFLFVRKVTQNTFTAWAIFLVTAFSIPFVTYSGQFFTETFAALLISYAAYALYRRLPNIFSQLFSIIAIAYLPWVHVKYIWVSIFLFLIWTGINTYKISSEANANKKKGGGMFLRNAGGPNASSSLGWLGRLQRSVASFAKICPRPSYYTLLGLIYIASAIFLAYIFKHWYGSFLPNAQYPSSFGINFRQLGVGTLGLLLDSHYGLLPYSPLYIFALAGFVAAFIKDRLLGFILAGSFLAVFILNASATINLGWAPVGRFWLPVLPLVAVGIGTLYQRFKPWSAGVFGAGVAWGWLSGYELLVHPDLNYSTGAPTFLSAMNSKLVDLTNYFPKIISMDQLAVIQKSDEKMIYLWLAAILVITILSIIGFISFSKVPNIHRIANNRRRRSRSRP